MLYLTSTPPARALRLTALAVLLAIAGALLSACGSSATTTSAPPPTDPDANAPPPARVIATKLDVRDGTALDTYIYLPAGDGPFPTLVNRTLYGLPISPIGGYDGPDVDEDELTDAEAIALGWPLINERGYALVIQVTRGRFESEGVDRSWLDDGSDGYDLIEWIDEQPWSDGRIGLFGDSAVGISALQAAAARPPALDAVYVQAAPGNPFGRDFMPENGASKAESLMVQGLAIAFDTSADHQAEMGLTEDRVGEIFGQSADYLGALFAGLDAPTSSPEWMALPLGANQSVGELMPFWQSLFDPAVADRYRTELDVTGRIDVPTYVVTLWQDVFVDSSIALFEDLQSRGVPSRMRVFNGSHYDIDEPALWDAPVMLEWFDYWLLGKANEAYTGPGVDYLLQGGTGDWQSSGVWPPEATSDLTLHLTDSDTLSTAAPDAVAESRSFVYDPGDPAPTDGGRHLLAPSGSLELSPTLDRNDVLRFTSEPLAQALTMAGNVTTDLYVATTGIDTDVVVKLIDRHPDGRAFFVVEDLVRLSRRNGRDVQEFVAPGSVVGVHLAPADIAHYFAAGHRIELAITSASFPAWDRNLNNGLSSFHGDHYDVVTNEVFADSRYPSRITLPVLNDR